VGILPQAQQDNLPQPKIFLYQIQLIHLMEVFQKQPHKIG
jgi:hypothetical protein